MALYLGIDSSTQGIKAEIIDTVRGEITDSFSVNFGVDLPQYGAPNGFIPHPDPLVKQADPLMWLDALDLLFARMRDAGCPLSLIAGISGSGQQHGSVYLNEHFIPAVGNLQSGASLSSQLRACLSRPVAPIWMDRSTSRECHELNARFGSRIQDDTGSPAIERFTGPQIRRFAATEPENYARTVVIHLVSSFLCSVMTGQSAPIDYGDGAGMNLLNLKTLAWDEEIVDFTAPSLRLKLPAVVASNTIAGTLPRYYDKYGFTSGIPVVVWSGDNQNSLIGVGAGSPGMAVISLGTSDTFFAAMKDYKTDRSGYGHVFGNPAGGFMSLICFSNGSLAREKIKIGCDVDWEFFGRIACAQTPPGNNGKLMLPYFEPESTPLVLTPQVKYNFTDATVAEKIRAVMESQALSMRLHSAWQNEDFKRLRITGGASKCPALRQILADVFQSAVETISVTNSAGLGAALRAANAIGGIPFNDLYACFCGTEESVLPIAAHAEIYNCSLAQYSKLESDFFH